MGWCSATIIFDNVASLLLDSEKKLTPREILKCLAEELEEGDWDCQCDSDYYDHPIVQGIFREMHPNWFDNE